MNYGCGGATTASIIRGKLPCSPKRKPGYANSSGVPVAVARLCRLTWMCAPEPKGLDIHANKAGYSEMTAAFRKVLGRAAR